MFFDFPHNKMKLIKKTDLLPFACGAIESRNRAQLILLMLLSQSVSPKRAFFLVFEDNDVDVQADLDLDGELGFGDEKERDVCLIDMYLKDSRQEEKIER